MTEIAKCLCGAAPTVARGISARSYVECGNRDCCKMGPFGATAYEAIAAWNALMRPRPVARWEWRSGTYAQYLSCGHVDLGYVMWKRGCVPPWVAYCAVTDKESGPMMLEDARAWLAERVSVEGFEVEETTDE